MSYSKEKAYIGNLAQIFAVKEYKLCGGRADGVRAIDISNGAGLDITLLPDRCMDLYQIRFQGKNLNFITPNGIVHPNNYQPDGDGWLRAYAAGFLTTCGLSNIGIPGEDDYGKTVMHGRIANTPAADVCIKTEVMDDVPTVTVTGTMHEAVLFGTNLTLTRTIVCRQGSNEVEVTDRVHNAGYHRVPHMILYHFNMGYPLLSETARIVIPHHSMTPRTDHAAAHASDWAVVVPPQDDFSEMCYYHDVVADETGMAEVGIDNPANGLSMRIAFDKSTLTHFVQWRMLGKGEYVTGLEPCNATIDGRDDALKNGSLKFLEPDQTVEYCLKIKVN